MSKIPINSEPSVFQRNLKGMYCTHPFKNIELHLNSQAYVCCPSWLSKSIGDFKKENVGELWNSASAQDIRESIIDGSYKYCDQQKCPLIQGNGLQSYLELDEELRDIVKSKQTVLTKMPENVMLTYEPSCNLSCPSCRSEKISYTVDSPEYKTVTEITKKVTDDLLRDPSQHQVINITGSGDPFASLSFRQFLESVDGSQYPNMFFVLQTNGLLLTPIMWERLSKIHNNIKEICVSIDAATTDSYKKIRRLGNWETIYKNMTFLCELRKQNILKQLQVNFVVQQLNYKEIPLFAEMFINMGCDSVFYSLIMDWGSMGEESFKKSDVSMVDHPDHNHFISILAHPILGHQKVKLGNLTSYRKLAMQRAHENLGLLQRTKFRFQTVFSKYYRMFFRNYFTLKNLVIEKYKRLSK